MENSNHLTPDNFEVIRNQLMLYVGGHVSLSKDDVTQIAYICINHPEKRNAISGVMAIELRECIEELEKWTKGKAVVVYGKGNNFCSGGDLDCERANETPQEGLNLVTWMHDTLNRLSKLPLVSVCIVQGPTLGGGAEISVSCDYIVAAETAKYGFVHGIMGLSPGWAGGLKLIRKVGQRKALDFLLTSKILSAQECVDHGIAEIVVPADRAVDTTVEWLKTRLVHHHTVTRAMKSVVMNSNLYSYHESLEREMYTMLSLWGKEANKQALERNIKHLKKR